MPSQNTYGGLRELTPDITVTVLPGGSLTAGSGFLTFQAGNRTGQNKLSDGASTPAEQGLAVSWTAGQKIRIEFGTGARASGEDIFFYIVSFSATNDVTTMQQVAKIRTRAATSVTTTTGTVHYPGQGVQLTLPIAIEITNDDQLVVGGMAADSSALPSNPLYGNVRYLQDVSQYWEYDDEASSGELAAGPGYWVRRLTGFNQYVASMTQPAQGEPTPQVQGAHRAFIDLQPGIQSDVILVSPAYPFDNVLQPVEHATKFMISNGDAPGAGSPILANESVDVIWLVDGVNKSIAFTGVAIVKLLGRVDRVTMELDTNIPGVDTPVVLEPTISGGAGGIITPAELSVGFGWVYSIQLKADTSAVAASGAPLTAGSVLTFYPRIVGSLGEVAPYAVTTGSVVNEVGDEMRVVPNGVGAVVSEGSATIYDEIIEQGYLVPLGGPTTIPGILTSTENQYVVISGPLKQVRLRQNPGDIQSNEGQIAVIGTGLGPDSGKFTASAYSGVVAIAGGTEVLRMVVAHSPTIRASYPDDRIAGSALGAVNWDSVVPFVEFGGTIYEMPAVTVGASPQNIDITDLAAGTVITNLPDTSADPGFGLYESITPTGTARSGSSSLAAGSYRIGFYYLATGNQVTRISHDTSNGSMRVNRQDENVARTNTPQTFTGSQRFNVTDVSSASGIANISTVDGNLYNWTLDEDVTAVNFSGFIAGTNFKMNITNPSESFTLSGWGGNVQWVSSAPTIGEYNVLQFISFNGTVLMGWEAVADEWVQGLATALVNVAYRNVAQAFTAAQRSVPVTLTIDQNGHVEIDCSLSNTYILVLTENVTEVRAINIELGTYFDLDVSQDTTGDRTVTGWSGVFRWSGDVAPTITPTANRGDLIAFKSFNGTTLKAGVGRNYQ